MDFFCTLGCGGIGRHEYEYATDGAITRWTRQSGGGAARTETYGYDAANRLLGATLTESGTPVRTLGYRYDVAGNRTSETASGVADQTPVAEYEAAEWDALGRMTAVIKGTRRSEFQYDGGGGRRVRITEKENNVVVSDSRYVWDGSEIAEERDAQTGGVTKRYFTNGVEDAGTKLFFTRDHLGSVRYQADFGYAGYWIHRPSQLNLTVFRAYDSNLGRWLARDPMGERAGKNLYRYVKNKPLSMIDPLGLIGFGLIANGTAEAGLGKIGAGVTGSGGVGFFSGGDCPSSLGGFASGGGRVLIGANAPPIGAPTNGYDNEDAGIFGAYTGVGAGLFFTNADDPCDLAGKGDTYNINTPFLGVSYSYSTGVGVLSITLGPGGAISLSTYPTYTVPIGPCCDLGKR